MIFGAALLAAGIGDILGFLVPIVFFIIYVLNQLLSNKGNPQQQARGAKPRGVQPAERAMRPAAPQAKPQGGAAQLNSEIEQFLRRAGQRRGERATGDRASRAAAAPRAAPQPVGARPREIRSQPPIDVEPIERRDFDEVAASVQKHLGSERFQERAELLADDVVHADEDMEQHLQQVFQHRLGKLGGQTAVASGQGADVQTMVVTDAPSPAAALAQLLRTPQGMRQAIVVSEILARPVDRW